MTGDLQLKMRLFCTFSNHLETIPARRVPAPSEKTIWIDVNLDFDTLDR